MTDPTGTPYGADTPDVEEVDPPPGRRPTHDVEESTEADPGTAQTEAEFTQGQAKAADRQVRPSWLEEGASILLDTALRFQSANVNDEIPIDDEYFTHQAFEQIKSLMLAGWCSPRERTLAVPNGLVLRSEQWRALAEGNDVHVMLPGGRQALVLEATASHGRPHFMVGSELHDELWTERERAAFEASGEPHGRGHGKAHNESTVPTTSEPYDWPTRSMLDAAWRVISSVDGVDGLGERQSPEWRESARRWREAYETRGAVPAWTNPRSLIPVPRSFLTSLVALAGVLHETGDYAAANSLDNFLAGIRAELQAAGIVHDDRGGHLTVGGVARMSDQERALVHALAYGGQLYDDIRSVLEYVSAGRRHIDTYGGYPDGRARRALGRLDDIARSAGNPPFLTANVARRYIEENGPQGLTGKTFISPTGRLSSSDPQPQYVPHPSTSEEDLRHQLGQRTDDCEKVRRELLPILQAHPQTKDEVAVPMADTLKAGYVAKIAAKLLTWSADELMRLKRDGVPGVVHEVDQAFHDLAIQERDLARAQVDRLEKAHRSTQEGLIRTEQQRDELRLAIADAVGLDFEKINRVDTDFARLLGGHIKSLEFELETRSRVDHRVIETELLGTIAQWERYEGIHLTSYEGWQGEEIGVLTRKQMTLTEFRERAEVSTYEPRKTEEQA